MLQKFRINMAFNPANAPHWGGSWERMIREVKKILEQCMDNHKKFSDIEFQTFLTRAEAILNRRPIAFMDDGEFLTPNHLINPAADIILPMVGENWIAAVSRVRDAILEFWSRWHKYYLTSIAAGHRMGQIQQHDLQPGDWVLVKDNRNPLIDTCDKRKDPAKFFPTDTNNLVRSVEVEVDGVKLYRDINKISVIHGEALKRKSCGLKFLPTRRTPNFRPHLPGGLSRMSPETIGTTGTTGAIPTLPTVPAVPAKSCEGPPCLLVCARMGELSFLMEQPRRMDPAAPVVPHWGMTGARCRTT